MRAFHISPQFRVIQGMCNLCVKPMLHSEANRNQFFAVNCIGICIEKDQNANSSVHTMALLKPSSKLVLKLVENFENGSDACFKTAYSIYRLKGHLITPHHTERRARSKLICGILICTLCLTFGNLFYCLSGLN